jgi:hypothetical protein
MRRTIADQALALLPEAEKAWLLPLKSVYLLGTEAPDFKGVPTACQTPNHGYDDRNQGHSVEWAANWSKMTKDRAATRAQEEYNKAALAYRQGKAHHSDYEGWVAQRTASFSGGTFETYISSEPRVRRSAYVAAKRISLTVARGKAPILSAVQMDSLWTTKPQPYLDSIGHSLNLGVNELADVLYTFFANVVSEED